MLAKQDGHNKRVEVDSYFIPLTKINFKWVKYHRPEIMKLPRENLEKTSLI